MPMGLHTRRALSAPARTVRHPERNTEMNMSEVLVTNITIERDAQRGLLTVSPDPPERSAMACEHG